MHKVYILLGSNIDDRISYLTGAVSLLEKTVGSIEKKSKIYETAAWGNENQAAFLNQVLLLHTSLPPQELIYQTQQIESQIGRVRKEKWGARIIDIDTLFFDDLTLNSPDLILPHPQLHLRRFTLLPLAEIAPELVHPVLNKTVEELLENCPDVLEVKVYKENKK